MNKSVWVLISCLIVSLVQGLAFAAAFLALWFLNMPLGFMSGAICTSIAAFAGELFIIGCRNRVKKREAAADLVIEPCQAR